MSKSFRDDSDDLIDVRSLFQDGPPPATPSPAGPATSSDHGEYALGGDEFDPEDEEAVAVPPRAAPVTKSRSARRISEAEAPALPRAPVAPGRPAAPPDDFEDFDDEPRPTKRRRVELEADEADSDADSGVDEVWTRWGEWGPTVLKLAVGAVLVLGLTYWLGANVGIGSAFLVLVLGMATLVLLSYPIAITLERPIRMTPEQAIKDFYAAASHHFPQYRRMWLLLSNDGKESGQFDSFASFRAYWKDRMARLRGGRVGKTTPLEFEVKDCRGDKSAGQTAVDVDYMVAVKARGRSGPPLEQVEVSTSCARGPDRMWYLDLGTLPEQSH